MLFYGKKNSVQCIVTPADSLLTVFLTEKQDKKFHFPHSTDEWFACNNCGLCMVLWSVRERCVAQYRVIIAVCAWYCGLLESAVWPSTV